MNFRLSSVLHKVFLAICKAKTISSSHWVMWTLKALRSIVKFCSFSVSALYCLSTPLDSKSRTTTSTRFDLIFFAYRYFPKIDTPESLIVLFSPEKLALLSLFSERNMLKLLTFDILFLHHDILDKSRSKMTTAIMFSLENDAGSRVSTIYIEKIWYSYS